MDNSQLKEVIADYGIDKTLIAIVELIEDGYLLPYHQSFSDKFQIVISVALSCILSLQPFSLEGFCEFTKVEETQKCSNPLM